ncbi:MAG: glycosyltransferase, partial [Betaproteobacteria bacterium]
LDAILPRAALLVHHGGIATAADAMRAGVPQWLFPSAHDQADNAARLVALGVARTFPAAAAEPALRAAARLLADPRLLDTLQTLKARLAAEPDGTATLVDWVMDDLRPAARPGGPGPAAVAARRHDAELPRRARPLDAT